MSNLRIHVIQHEPFEGPGLVQDWATANGHELTITEIYSSVWIPSIEAFDWLIIMGGGMSVNDEDKLLWLPFEKQFVKRSIEAGKTVIGFCLGSQMIANVLGKKVYKNEIKEIGWYPVTLTDEAKTSGYLSDAWDGQTFFHWHGETFDLPDNAIHLVSRPGCSNQAFVINNRVFGFQFHPETNYQTLHQMVEAGKDELVKDKYVMTSAEILEREKVIERTKQLCFGFLDSLVQATATTTG